MVRHPSSSDHFLVINVKDFDPSIHEILDAEDKAEGIDTDAVSHRDREAELKEMDWRELKAIAEDYGLSKPESGWDEVVPQILSIEYADDM